MKGLKAIALAGASLAVLLAAPASAETTGFGSFSVGYNYIDVGGSNGDAWNANLTAGASLWESMFNLQGEVGWENTDLGFTDVDAFNIGGTVFYRDSSQYAFGGSVNWHGIAFTGGTSIDALTFGGFGEFYLEQFTLGGSLFGIDGDGVNGWGMQLDGTFYICDSASLGASYRRYDTDFTETDVFRIDGEYKIEGSALALGANYEHVEYTAGDADVFGATLKFRFGDGGGDVLMARDRNGAVDMRNTIAFRHSF